ncbi:MAG: two-component system response regulator AtoC [Verrucomicrobiales bacterium]|jgi:two-component system response regulator AtoC
MLDITLLIVDDEKNTRDGLRLSFEDEFDVYVASDKAEALELLKHEHVDVMITDLRLGADNGMEVIDEALQMGQPPICIMMTAYGSVDTAVEAMKRGAYDFVTKPLNIDALEILIKRALKSRSIEHENVSLKKQVEKKFSLDKIVGQSAALARVFETIEQVAPTRATVLVEGETGTGKELVAHALHNLSGRPKAKLVTVHCAGLPPQLLESELFGHEKGAFTDAKRQRIGRFEEADGGTLFLDELGEIDLNTQVKLLRALGERKIQRVGGNASIPVDVRVLAATNRYLEQMVADGKFREDLYYRLNVVKIVMPPLRERKEDIVLLADAFLKEVAEENAKPVKELSADALQKLVHYHWPGNVRELRTAIEHGVVMSNAAKITLRHLPQSIREFEGRPIIATADGATGTESVPPIGRPTAAGGQGVPAIADLANDDLNLAAMEGTLMARALEHTDGNRTEAAKLLGISRRTLQRKLQADR